MKLHNNHHTFAASAKLSVRWWEFDIGWMYIRGLQLLKLAKVHRAIPKVQVNQEKMTLDIDSLKAIVNNRFYIMNDYWKEVIVPVVKNEKPFFSKHGKRFIRQSSKLLVREESLIKQEDHNFLQTMLRGRSVFETVYSFRLKLQEIWHMTNISQQELLDVVNRWCKQAEASGVAALQDFAQRLRCYSLPAPSSR